MKIHSSSAVFGAVLMLLVPGCGGRQPKPLTPSERKMICEICGWTGSTEPGYLATLDSDGILLLDNGEKRFACPSCGQPGARPLLDEPQPPPGSAP
jgi:hypothetical protein